MDHKLFITNRSGKRIAVLLDVPKEQSGLAFVMHGLGGFKEQPQVEAFAKGFLDAKCIVVRFDCRNTLGESEGKFEDARLTNYYEDLEDVISWARQQSWFISPFFLCGHSLGGIAVAWYAEKNPKEVCGLAPLGTVVSGQLTMEAHGKEEIAKWKETGWFEERSNSKPGVLKRRPWAMMDDLLRYDLRTDAAKLTMPVLFVVGDLDQSTPYVHQKLLFDLVSGRKEIHVLKGAKHTIRDEKHLQELTEILKKWLFSVKKG
ncbi:MAG: alpha/beta hydrolase [Nanoarchaeota archaeon]